MKRHLVMGAAASTVLCAVTGACGARDGATPVRSTPPRPTGAPIVSAAHAPGAAVSANANENGPSFACPGPLESCVADACPDGLTCIGDGNVACGDAPPLGKPCPAGTCELAGAELGSRVCLPDGCCAPKVRVPNAPSCNDGAPTSRIEVERAGSRETWLACLESSTGRHVNEFSFRDGTRLVFTFSDAYAEHIGEPRLIRGFMKPPRAKLGGAIVAFGAGATLVRNPYDQEQIVAARARVFLPESSERVDGAVVFGDPDRRRADEFGMIAGESLPADGLGTGSCGTDPEDTFRCSALIGTDGAPTWLFVELDRERTLVDAFVAWSRPSGADVFVAGRATVDKKGRVDLGDLRRLGRADDTLPSDAVVRITIDD